MSIQDRIRKIRDDRYKKRIIRDCVDRLTAKYNKLSVRRELTPAQEKEIKQYYKELTGEDIPLIWHKFLYSRTGVYSKKYLPYSLYKTSLLYRANKRGYRDCYADKNMAETFIPDVRHPKMVLKNMNGYYYDGNGKAVSYEEALQLCRNLDDCLIKHSLGTHGIGVHRLTVKEGQTNVEGLTLEQLFAQYEDNWCIQRFIRQHERMAALNPSSVNTIRVLSYRSGMEILVLYTVIRIGRAGQEIDNECAGGISTVIEPDGTLGRYAYGDPGVDQVEYTDTGIRLEGYQIPGYDKVVETVKRMHYELPFFNMIGWDIAVDEDAEPVLVEWNVCPELSQSANGPALGENTERIIRELYTKKNSWNPDW